jgi:RNA polymerase sigma-70 factor (ECF subfamily)
MEGSSYLRTPEAILPPQENPMVKNTRQISKDDLADFEAEALPYSNDLYRTALRLLGQPSKASDAVQETYLLAWKSFDRYQRGTNCKAWLFRILFNVVRHERRAWFKWITGANADLSQLDRVAPQPISTSLSDEAILAALDALGRQFREVVLLVDVQEFSYKEVSDILDIPIGTVMSRLSRARTLLRKELMSVAASYGISGAVC